MVSLSSLGLSHKDLPPVAEQTAKVAFARQSTLTKPPGSLGKLEKVPVQLAALQNDPTPSVRPASVLLFACDHTMSRHGVSPYPREVTAKMVENFAGGGAAASVLSSSLDMPLHVIDVGVESDYKVSATLVRRDTVADAPEGDLLAGEENLGEQLFAQAFNAGRNAVASLNPKPKLLVLGEMGIGNSTLSAAIASAFLDVPAEEITGPGTGAQGALLQNKKRIVKEAVSVWKNHPKREDALSLLSVLGGKEHAAIAGAMWEARLQNIAVLVDGFIVTAAIAPLVRACPAVRECLLFGHQSREPGHQLLLQAMDVEALLDLNMALGEGSGALTAFPVVELACSLHRKMATFESAGVPNAS